MARTRAVLWGVAVALAAAVWGAGPVSAHWAYTKWNMTLDEVRQAAPEDTLKDATEIEQRLRGRGDLQLLLVGTHQMGRYAFDVDFLFFENQLQRVTLYLRDPGQCPALEAELNRNYPKSNIDRSEGALTSREYQDQKNFNVLYFYSLPGQKICRLSYSFTLSYEKFAH